MQGVPCSSCRHFNAEVQDKDVCAAFPDGIPSEIILGKNPHRDPVEGDHDIQWQPVPEMAWMDVEGT